jgi:hypothetical protein
VKYIDVKIYTGSGIATDFAHAVISWSENGPRRYNLEEKPHP